MRILGVDPGSSRCGYGLIEKNGSKLTLIDYGLIEVKEKDINHKLTFLAHDYKKVLKKLKPDLVAIEKIFFSRNVKTAMEVAQARGVLIYLSLKENVILTEHNPQEVKLSVTGYGLSDKKAVARMVFSILQIPPVKLIDDVTDAIAISITAANLTRNIS